MLCGISWAENVANLNSGVVYFSSDRKDSTFVICAD